MTDLSAVTMCGALYAIRAPHMVTALRSVIIGRSQHCTCWKPIHDRRQRRALRAGPPVVRARACSDCAYRPDSPERAGADGYACNDGELDALYLTDRTRGHEVPILADDLHITVWHPQKWLVDDDIPARYLG